MAATPNVRTFLSSLIRAWRLGSHPPWFDIQATHDATVYPKIQISYLENRLRVMNEFVFSFLYLNIGKLCEKLNFKNMPRQSLTHDKT